MPQIIQKRAKSPAKSGILNTPPLPPAFPWEENGDDLLKTRAKREFELAQLMLHDKPALHQEYRRVLKRSPKGETDRELILSILNLEYPRSEAPPRNKTRANPAGTR